MQKDYYMGLIWFFIGFKYKWVPKQPSFSYPDAVAEATAAQGLDDSPRLSLGRWARGKVWGASANSVTFWSGIIPTTRNFGERDFTLNCYHHV